jgi:PKD repeat protein
VLPVVLLLVFAAIDFGRVYLGWINLQQMARIAANYAANHASGLVPPYDASDRERYRELVAADARAINCTLPEPLPDPQFPAGTDPGDPVRVQIDCRFRILTPVIGDVLGGQIAVTGGATFPVKEGVVGSVPGGSGGAPVVAPVADFTASPRSGFAPLEVTFTDASANTPTSWTWDTGDGIEFERTFTTTYATPGLYTVTLTVQNAGGTDSTTRTDLVEVLPPPAAGPIPEFSAAPRAGMRPLTVVFANHSTGDPVAWAWDFGDGATSTAQNPEHTYAAAGAYDVRLRVTDAAGLANEQTKRAFVLVAPPTCTVPNFAGTKANGAQARWSAAGFATSVTRQGGNGNYTIGYQSLPGGLLDPPGGCDGARITVGP